MVRTFKVLSALLSYPTRDLQKAAGEMRSALRGAIVSPAVLADLERLIGEIGEGDLFDLEERYVVLFDRTRSLSLHLFEHVHGESRDRGQAMIDLKDLYERNGLAIDATELPDFLPLFLEFLSTRPIAEARDLLDQTAHIAVALHARLVQRESSYAAIFAALTDLAVADPARATIDDFPDEPDVDPDDLAALDAAWEDTPVTFGPEAASSCKDDLVARIRAAKRPAARPA
ncbi:MAG: nitrate reductase molybdenum cofactor assembly chaperone [Bauldia litoralis]